VLINNSNFINAFLNTIVGKQTLSAIPITNEGNATLHILSFELVESRFFIKPIDWPTEKYVLVFTFKT
jgi:hypothetical protein